MNAADKAFEEWFWPNNRQHSMKADVSDVECPEDNLFGVHYFAETGRGIIARQSVEVWPE